MKSKASFSSILIIIIILVIIGVGVKYGINASNVDSETGARSGSSTVDGLNTADETVSQAPIVLETISIKAPGGTITALVADTLESQERGLGGRDSLPADQGMLFTFDEPGSNGFWMADMRFSLDMVWVDEGKKVVGVTANISPETYPEVFLPPSPVSYVLELNAGAAKRFSIATGTQLVF